MSKQVRLPGYIKYVAMNLRFIILFFIISIPGYAQEKPEKILYVVDSIPIFKDVSEEEGTLSEDIIDHIEIITTKSKFGEYQIYDFDKLIFVFTKEYTKRPDDIKRIPSFSNKFYEKDDKWYLKGFNTPYTGAYIDYYLNGIKKEEGYLKNGQDDGLRTYYYKDGKPKLYKTYSHGMLNGETGRYFINGKTQYKGQFLDGKEIGQWKEWYSTGEIKWDLVYKSGKIQSPEIVIKALSFIKKGSEAFEKENYKGAVDHYQNAINIFANYSDAYFHQSRAFLYLLKFDEALADCNKVLELEPLNKDAYSLRAFIRIRKNELKNSRTLIQNKEISVYASKDKVDFSEEDKLQICTDLKKAYELGETNQMVIDAIKKYCN